MAMVLDGLVSAVMEKIVDAGIKKIASILGVKSEMEALQRNMKKIRRVLGHAKSKKIESETMNFWLAEFREVMYDVEDLLDDWQVEADQKVAAAGDTSLSWIASLPLIFSEVFKNKIATRIEVINSTLDGLNSEAPSLHLLENLPDADKKVSSLITGTSSFQLDSEIVGIDDDATTDLVNRIRRDSNRPHSLFAITGMGGIGKTTLARKVFNHRLIQNHFDNTIWVCVSSNRRGEDLLREIIRSFDKNYNESGVSPNELSSKVIEVVKEKRVFIVLDDIWDSHFWEKFLKVPLHTGAKHSRILITTRNQQVAKEIKYVRHTHSMKEMNPSDGWSMLCKILFEEEDKGDMKDFADVGKQIVDKCKGLPLAINVVGGVLRTTDRTTDAWTRVLLSRTWSMQDLPKDIPPSLLLSYEDLSPHLKQCFTYCSLFPEDYIFSRFKLENLWIAEGFVEKVEGKDVEYFARDYYNELVMRNLLQANTIVGDLCVTKSVHLSAE